MSRVGKSPVVIPNGVQVELNDSEIVIKGKLGELKSPISGDVKVIYKKASDNEESRSKQ